MKKTTLVFPSSEALWRFFAMTDIKEFRIESAKCAVTARFSKEDIRTAKEQLNASVENEE